MIGELTRRYQQHLAVTGDRLGATAAQTWDELGSWDEADIETFTARLQPAAVAAQSHAASLAAAFIALATTSPITPVTAPSVDWAPAFFVYWKSLTAGTWEDALQVGRNQAEALGFDAVQSAARDASAQIDRQQPAITRWARIPDAGACDWCLEVAGDQYLTAESADFGHNRCGCSVVPA